MNQAMTLGTLQQENVAFRDTGGVSEENRSFGFRPGFIDRDTGVVYLSRYADGRPAPFHLLDGLPGELVVARTASGKVARVKDSITSGFLRGPRFYTRDEAAGEVAAESSLAAAA